MEKSYKEKYLELYGQFGFLATLCIVLATPINLICMMGGFWPIMFFWILLVIFQIAGAAIFALIPQKENEPNDALKSIFSIAFATLLSPILIPFVLAYLFIKFFYKKQNKKTWFQGKGEIIGRFFPLFLISYILLLSVMVTPIVFLWHKFEPWYFNTLVPWFDRIIYGV